jgi:hypothetical protein
MYAKRTSRQSTAVINFATLYGKTFIEPSHGGLELRLAAEAAARTKE